MNEVDEISDEDLHAASEWLAAWESGDSYIQRATRAAKAHAHQIALSPGDLDLAMSAYACNLATIDDSVDARCKTLLSLRGVRLDALNAEAMEWLVARQMGVTVTLIRQGNSARVECAGSPFWNAERADAAVQRWRIETSAYAPHGFMHDGATMWGARTRRNEGGLLSDYGYGATREQAILHCAVMAAHALGQLVFDVPMALVDGSPQGRGHEVRP
jgi:hypothetical protein